MLDGNRYPALVLNADFSPMSVIPLETWCWENAIHAVIAERVSVVAEYEQVVRSPSLTMRIPSVIAHREYHDQNRPAPCNRINVYVRDKGKCAYCGQFVSTYDMTYDHVVPKSRGGKTIYCNLVVACDKCNLRKRNRTPAEANMPMLAQPRHPTIAELNRIAVKMRLSHLQKTAVDNLYWKSYLEA